MRPPKGLSSLQLKFNEPRKIVKPYKSSSPLVMHERHEETRRYKIIFMRIHCHHAYMIYYHNIDKIAHHIMSLRRGGERSSGDSGSFSDGTGR